GYESGDFLTWAASGSTGDILSGAFNSVTHSITLSSADATAAQWDAALDQVDFVSSAGAGARTIGFTVTDSFNSNSNTGTDTVDVVIGPQIVAGATATFQGGGPAVVLDGTLSVSDAAQSSLTGASVSIGAGFTAGDLLNFTNQNGIAGSYDAG